MLQFLDVKYVISGRIIVDKLSFTLEIGDKAALVGDNGSGKSTVFRLIQGIIFPTEGKILFRPDLKIHSIDTQNPTITITVRELLLSQHNQSQIILILNTLSQLGFQQENLDKPIEYLSAGNKMRLLLATGITLKPELLLLDEPDKFLDIESQIALVHILREYQGTFILITFNDALRRQVTNKTIMLVDPRLRPTPSFTFSPHRLSHSGMFFSYTNVSVGYGKPVLSGITATVNPKDRIAILGRNGSNKSTICKLIADKVAPLEGTVYKLSGLEVGYFHSINAFNKDTTVLEELHEAYNNLEPEVLIDILGSFGLGPEIVSNKLSTLSSGEITRLSIAILNKNPYNIIIFDEPTVHLDDSGKALLIDAINNFSGAVVIISHDVDFMRQAAKQYWVAAEGKFSVYDRDIDDYLKSALTPHPTTKLALM